MPSKNALGIAPLVCGTVLLSGTLTRLGGGAAGTLSTVSLAAQLLGGGAAVVVGLGILVGWGSFGTGANDADGPTGTVLAGVAAVALALGLAGVVLG